MRWVATENLVLTAGYSNIDIINLNTQANGRRFSFYGSEDLPQIDPTLLHGGLINGLPAAPEGGNASRAGIPETVLTFTGTYAFENGWAVNASVIDVEETPSGYTRVVTLPGYTLVNLGVVYEGEDWRFSLTGKNLTDERYFRANFPNLFGSQIVLPELPVNWQASVSFAF